MAMTPEREMEILKTALSALRVAEMLVKELIRARKPSDPTFDA